MTEINLETRMTSITLTANSVTNCEIARFLGITEESAGHTVKRMHPAAVDDRSPQEWSASSLAETLEIWCQPHRQGVVDLSALHDWLVMDHRYVVRLGSAQRCGKSTHLKLVIHARVSSASSVSCKRADYRNACFDAVPIRQGTHPRITCRRESAPIYWHCRLSCLTAAPLRSHFSNIR